VVGALAPCHTRAVRFVQARDAQVNVQVSVVDSEQVFVLQCPGGEQVFGAGGRHVGRI